MSRVRRVRQLRPVEVSRANVVLRSLALLVLFLGLIAGCWITVIGMHNKIVDTLDPETARQSYEFDPLATSIGAGVILVSIAIWSYCLWRADRLRER